MTSGVPAPPSDARILGVDIGGVIIEKHDDEPGTSFFGPNFLASPPVPGAPAPDETARSEQRRPSLVESQAMATGAGQSRTAELFEAIGQGEVSTVQRLLAEGADATAVDSDGSTTLHRAALAQSGSEAERVQVLRLLIEAGADVNAADSHGTTPLMLAVADDGDVAHVRALIEAGASVNLATADGATPLMRAADNLGHVASLRCLLAAGADPHAKTADGWTALMAAVRGWPDAAAKVSALLEAGTDPHVVDPTGRTLLQVARDELASWIASEPDYTLSRRTREFRDRGMSDAREVIRLLEAATRGP